MKKIYFKLFCCALLLTTLGSLVVPGQRRRVVVKHRPHHTTLVVRTGHPIHRVLPTTVVVHPAHRTVVVGAPLIFLPALAWTAAIVSLPPRERLVWQDTEAIAKDEDWVDTSFGIDGTGDALYLDINGKARLNFAEVTFANGNVQVVDFNEKTHKTGIYKLLDLRDDRHIMTVRLLVKSESDATRLALYLGK
ncbi:MAG: hypothetical protein HY231_00565 [Acidobacteria bacterium]|nr:hypothetical protein [Acidobacteriota bacterium]